MLFGKKSDLKNHLSMKKPSWTHHVVAQGAHEQNLEMERQQEPPQDRGTRPDADRPEPGQTRY